MLEDQRREAEPLLTDTFDAAPPWWHDSLS
jgi:hypothetical protein